MKNKSYKSAVVIIPPETKWSIIQQIRKEIDKKYYRWMPHITLIYPFVPILDLQKAKNILSAQKWSSLLTSNELKLDEIKYFSHGNNSYTIWAEPTPSDIIHSLFRQLMILFPDFDDVDSFPGGYTPHLSLGQAYSSKDLEEKLIWIKKIWQPVQFNLQKFHIIIRDDPPNDIFDIFYTLYLQ